MKRLLFLTLTVTMTVFAMMAECTDPYFKGGDEKLQQWFVKKMKYPEQALTDGKSGCVTLEVSISEKGEVTDYSVKQFSDPMFTEEAVRLIEKMPKWKPATCDGRKTAAKVQVTVQFDPSTWIQKHTKHGNWFGTAGAGIGISL